MDLKPIPGTRGYLASSDGRIFGPDMTERKQTNHGKYKFVFLELFGEKRSHAVHRLVLLAHKPVENANGLYVNHRNFKPWINCVTNLEWLTAAQNNWHLALFRPNPKKPLLYMEKDGQYWFGHNLPQICGMLDCQPLDVWDAILYDELIKGYKLTIITNQVAYPKALRKSLVGTTRGINAVDVYHIHTEVRLSFPSTHTAARHFGVDAGHISMSVYRGSKVTLFKGEYVIVREGEAIPEFDKEELFSRIGSTGFPVIVYDKANEQYLIYPSASRFIKDKKLVKNSIASKLKDSKVGPVEGYYFAYYKSPNKELLFDVVGRPGP